VRPLGFEPRTCGLRGRSLRRVSSSVVTCGSVPPFVHLVALRAPSSKKIAGRIVGCVDPCCSDRMTFSAPWRTCRPSTTDRHGREPVSDFIDVLPAEVQASLDNQIDRLNR